MADFQEFHHNFRILFVVIYKEVVYRLGPFFINGVSQKGRSSLSDLTSMGFIALIVAGIAAVFFLNFFRKSALHLLLTSIHSALVGIGLILLAYVVQGSELLLLAGSSALLFGVFLSAAAFVRKES